MLHLIAFFVNWVTLGGPAGIRGAAKGRRAVMAEGTVNEGRISHRGFASMDAERQRQIASMGGKAVPDEKRSFSQNRRLAAAARRKGGQRPGLAAEAGRRGGQASHGGGPRPV